MAGRRRAATNNKRTAAKRYKGGSNKKSSTSRTAPGRTAKTGRNTKKKSNWRDSAKKMAKNYKGKNTKKKTTTKKKGSKFPSIQDYLMGDQYYQSGLSDLEWALEQFLSENDAAEGDVRSSFDSAMGYMNLDKKKAHEYMKDDYGARGIVFSGLYPKAVSDYNEEWSMGAADLNRDLASQMRDLGFEESNMRQSTEMQKKDLRLDAIRRRQEEVQQNQFNNKAGYSGKKKTAGKKSTSKAPAKKQSSRKTGVRKSGGGRRLRKR